MKLKHLILVTILTTSLTHAKQTHIEEDSTSLTASLYGSKGNQEVALDALVKKLPSIGYNIVKSNKHIQEFYYQKFKEKNVEMISFFGITNDKEMQNLLLKNPDFGAYAPFNLLAYKTLDTNKDDNTWYGHLDADTMLNIMQIKDVKQRATFESMILSLDNLIKKEMNPTKIKVFRHKKEMPKNSLIKMVMRFDKPEDLEEFIEDFVATHDTKFSQHDFIIAGFKDFKFDYDDMNLEFDKYDAYWVSMLCHFKFSNSIFNRGKPEAGMFAPCTVYFYIPKGLNELHVGYASVNNWVNALDFKNKKRIGYMQSIDAEVIETLKELGFTKE